MNPRGCWIGAWRHFTHGKKCRKGYNKEEYTLIIVYGLSEEKPMKLLTNIEIKDKSDECNSLFVLVTPFEDTSNLSLKGICQQENLSLALAAVRYLFPQIPEHTIQDALKEVKNPCRFQICREDLIVDASHNPNGVMALRESLDFYYPDKKRCFVFGCLKNKDYKKMMEILFSKGDEIYFYHFNNKNSCTIEELQSACDYPSKIFENLDKLPKDYLKIICGSFYMLNEIIPENLVH